MTRILPFLLAASYFVIAGRPAASAASERAAGQPFVFPDTAAGRAFGEWLQAYNAADIEGLRAFHRSHSPPEQVEGRTALDLLSRLETGGVDPHSVVRSSEHEIVLRGRSRLTELWLEGRMALSPEPPHLVLGIGGRPIPPPDGAASAPLSPAELRVELDRYLEKLADAGVFSGTVLVAKDGVPLYSRALGYADLANGALNLETTRFNLGSMNKMFTAVAIAQLVEQGLLSFDDPVGRHVSGLPTAVAERVTIGQLLSHTGGTGDFFGPGFDRIKDSLISLRDYLPLFINQPLRFEPGTSWAYSNGGFILLGLVIESVSGQDYFEYIRDQIYARAGMTASDSFRRDASIADLAHGYATPLPPNPADLTAEAAFAPRVDNYDFLPLMGSSAGGGYSTVRDLNRFAIALQDGSLVSRTMADRLMSGAVSLPFNETERYGYGFQEERYLATRISGHGGGFPGVSSKLDVYRDLGYTVVVLSNVDGGAQPVVAKIKELLVRG
jgi:CubicO group peptidase (beta-lactamase class C family)